MSTDLFRLLTPASPDQVWEQLTRRCDSYLWGLPADTTWTAGAPLSLGAPDGPEGLRGLVLCARRPERLSFSLGGPHAEPSIYVTWEITAAENGSIVRLYVDDPEGHRSDDDGDAGWLLILRTLAARLGATRPPGRT